MDGNPATLPGAPGPVWYPLRRLVGAARKIWRGFPFPYRLPWGGWMLLHLDGTGLGLLRGTYPEHPELRFLSRFLQPGMTVLDIGANQGVYTLVAAKAAGAQGRVFAFEPSPSELAKLRWNLRLNRVRNVAVIESAVAAGDGTTTFHAAIPMKGGFSGIRRPAEGLGVTSEVITVPVTTIDAFVGSYEIETVDFMKVDVEGAEMELLEGAHGLLTRAGRPILQLEFNDERTSEWGYAARDLGVRMMDLGFHLFGFEEWNLVPHPLADRYDHTVDIVGVPDEREAGFRRFLEDLNVDDCYAIR